MTKPADAFDAARELARQFGPSCWVAYRRDRERTYCACGDGKGAVGRGDTWEQAIVALGLSRVRCHFDRLDAARKLPWFGYGKASW